MTRILRESLEERVAIFAEPGEGHIEVTRSKNGRGSTIGLHCQTVLGARLTLYVPLESLPRLRAALFTAEGGGQQELFDPSTEL